MGMFLLKRTAELFLTNSPYQVELVTFINTLPYEIRPFPLVSICILFIIPRRRPTYFLAKFFFPILNTKPLRGNRNPGLTHNLIKIFILDRRENSGPRGSPHYPPLS